MNRYEEKRQARIERLRARAAAARAKSDALHTSGMDMLRAIPFGQPILVGHHSEKSDRAYRARAGSRIDRAIEEQQKAEYYEGRASSAESNRSISSDDPEAVVKLRAKTMRAESLQQIMVAANRIVRASKMTIDEKVPKLCALGLTEAQARRLFEPDFVGRVGFPDYALQNNNANIRRMKQRLAELERSTMAETKETEHNGIRIVENVEENRIQIIFPGKPEASVRSLLKSNGFRWSPMNSAWQRHLNSSGKYAAHRVLEEVCK